MTHKEKGDESLLVAPFALLPSPLRGGATELTLITSGVVAMDEPFARRTIEQLGGRQLHLSGAPGAFAFLSAVRRAERCARLRTVAARDLRMFFLADAIFGTKTISKKPGNSLTREGWNLEFNDDESQGAITL